MENKKHIKIVEGNILDCKEKYIVDCRNCQGKMQSGVAGAIANRYPEIKEDYIEFCNKNGKPNKKYLLGQVHIKKSLDNKKVFYGIFGQYEYGYDRKCYVDYQAIQTGLEFITIIAKGDIAIPYGIGCGRAGGDWNKMIRILENINRKFKYNIVLYKYKEKNNKFYVE